MDYRNFIKSRNLRIKILSFLDWIPDSIMLRLQYWIQTGRRLHINQAQRYTEKIQVYKMKYRNPDMLRCTDKYEVRGYVEEKGLGEYLIPLIGIYNNVEDIDFKSLPQQFVVKTTDGSGGNQVILCKDKNELKEDAFYERLNSWMSMPKTKNPGREWAYENGFPRRILIEKLIGENKEEEVPDFKFFCFDGEPQFLYVSDNLNNELVFLDLDWKPLPFVRTDFKKMNPIPPKPKSLNTMIEVAKKLSANYPHVQVDLYSVEEKVYFGELTFYTSSGYIQFNPDSADFDIGGLFHLEGNGGGKFYLITSNVSRRKTLSQVEYRVAI